MKVGSEICDNIVFKMVFPKRVGKQTFEGSKYENSSATSA